MDDLQSRGLRTPSNLGLVYPAVFESESTLSLMQEILLLPAGSLK